MFVHSLQNGGPQGHSLNMPSGERHIHWMQSALKEARKGCGLTSPNPPVGALIVKDNQLIGSGWHKGAGLPHAEREAISKVLENYPAEALRGATIYVTLEPCSTHGKTPPCTEGIIEAGIKTVVYGAQDPNPNHDGGAEKILQSAGIKVYKGICEAECRDTIKAFSKVQRTGLPWVILKSAISLDGKTTRPPGESQWLSSPESREFVQSLRFRSDGIITGGNTLRADNPALTLRSSSHPNKVQPWRMIITRGSRKSLPQRAQVFTDKFAQRTLVEEQGDLSAALQTLVKKGCNTVMVEAGGTLMASFLQAGLADELVVFYAPLLTGGPDKGFGDLTPNVKLTEQRFTRIGSDILLQARIRKPAIPHPLPEAPR